MSDDLFMYWSSQQTGTLVCYANQAKTTPLDLTNKPLMLIAKKRLTDTDSSAIFTLTLGNGLTLDDTPSHNVVSFTIPALETSELSRTKDTTLWVELLSDPDGQDRQTIQQFQLPIRASVKE